MTKEQLAGMLNGREIGNEISKAESKQAKADGLVVVYGASDDLMEFDGAICDEVGAYDGTTAHLSSTGLLKNECDSDDCPHYEASLGNAATITAEWCAAEDGPSWTYSTPIPHATFDVMEDGEVYCRGIVFSLADAAQREAAKGGA